MAEVEKPWKLWIPVCWGDEVERRGGESREFSNCQGNVCKWLWALGDAAKVV